MTPEILFNLEDSDYRKRPGVSYSALKRMLQSPLHYRYYLDNPPERTPAMLIGQIAHLAIFEPDKCITGKSHAVKPEGMSFATKEGKAWRDAQTAPIIGFEDAAAIEGMACNVRKNKEVSKWLAKGCAEVSLFAPHDSGCQRKGRVDWMPDCAPIFIDAKTIDDASTFERSAATLRYHQQAAYYLDLAKANDVEIERFVFIVCEKQPPHGVRLVEFDGDSLRMGHEANERALARIAECAAKNDWPGYNPFIHRITLPAWARQNHEDEDLAIF